MRFHRRNDDGRFRVVGTPVSLYCSPDSTEFGQIIECVSSGPADALVPWPDGTETPVGQHGHAPKAVGTSVVQLVASDQQILAETAITIDVDLDVTCEEGSQKLVYELVPDDSRTEGWNYAYLNPETGGRVLPGADDYPVDPGMTPYEAVILDEAPRVGLCTARSAAAEALDGTYNWVIDTGWGKPLNVPFDSFVPWSRDHWNGTQPGTATVTVEVDGIAASEMKNVYLSGCN